MPYILHIGTHKTGTTYLQNHYFKSLENVIYINDNNKKEIGKKNISGNAIYSCEGLSGVAWNNDWLRGFRNDFCWLTSFDRAVNEIKKQFEDPVIMIVFRKHGELTLSLYKQYVQEGGVLSFHEFFNENGVINFDDLNYKYRINKLKKNFSSVLILSYEDFKELGDSYFDQVLKKYDIYRYGDISKKVVNKRINRSLSGSKLELLRQINKGYRYFPSRLKKILNSKGLKPRKILQNNLSFWDSKDQHYLSQNAIYINEILQKDWNFVESNKIKI